MRKIYLLLTAIITGLTLPASAQFYTAYDFEPVAGVPGCSFILPSEYDQKMQNTGCFFGDTLINPYVPGLHLLDEHCDEGKPHSGKYFIGIAASKDKSDKLSLKLADPVQLGRTYKMVIHFKRPINGTVSGSTCDVEFGYGLNCDQVGTTFYTLNKPTDTLWDTVSMALNPPEGTRYITIVGVPTGVNFDPQFPSTPFRGFTYLDNIQVSWVPSSIDDVNKAGKIELYPNPFTSSASFNIDERMALPCRVSMFDMTGRKVYEETNINTRKVTVRRDNLKTGIYMLELSDREGARARTRIMIE